MTSLEQKTNQLVEDRLAIEGTYSSMADLFRQTAEIRTQLADAMLRLLQTDRPLTSEEQQHLHSAADALKGYSEVLYRNARHFISEDSKASQSLIDQVAEVGDRNETLVGELVTEMQPHLKRHNLSQPLLENWYS